MPTAPAIHPPVTLSAADRAAFDSWPTFAQANFQALAGELEFIRGKSMAQAEAEAFEAVLLKHRAPGGGASRTETGSAPN